MGIDDLIALQKAVFDSYITNVWQTLGMFFVAIGWVMTSDKARIFLKRQRVARLACISAACAILAIHFGVLAASYNKSEWLATHIGSTEKWKAWVVENAEAKSDTQKTPPNSKMTILDVYKIRPSYPIVSGSLATILVLSFIVMVHQIRSQETTRSADKAIDSDT